MLRVRDDVSSSLHAQPRNIGNGVSLRNEPNSLKTAIFTRFVGALHRHRKPFQVLLRESHFCWASGLSHEPSVASKIIFAKKFGYLLR